jgi:hypothetical protein
MGLFRKSFEQDLGKPFYEYTRSNIEPQGAASNAAIASMRLCRGCAEEIRSKRWAAVLRTARI